MNFHNEPAAPMGSIIGNGGSVVTKAVAAQNYPNRTEIATADYATRVVATRFRLTISTARLVCHLAGIGGAA